VRRIFRMKTYCGQETARALIGRGGINTAVTRFAQLAVVAFTVIALAGSARASDPVGIYALVDKVVLEPNDKAPERAQIWGAFSLAEGRGDGYSQPKRGYLYYKLNADKPEVSKKEWADLKSVAGTDEVVAFGGRYTEKGEIRKADDKPKNPDAYPLGFGLQKIRENHWNAGPVKALRQLARKNAGNSQTPRGPTVVAYVPPTR